MAGGFHIYYEAAEALWEMSSKRLEEMAREDASAGNRKAAMATLRLKAEFVSPEAFGNERSSISKLAGLLNDEPGVTLETAMRLGTPARKRSTKTLVQAGVVRPSGLSRTMWLAITAGVVLLLMDVLATAGVPVPSPIEAIIEGFSGDDEPLSPAPPPEPRRRKGNKGRSSILGDGGEPVALTGSKPRASNDRNEDHKRDRLGKAEGTILPTVDETPAGPARGRELNQAQGRESNQAQGREENQARGREEHQPDVRGNSSTKLPHPRGPNPRSNGRGPSGE
jgi:hypothetical protein